MRFAEIATMISSVETPDARRRTVLNAKGRSRGSQRKQILFILCGPEPAGVNFRCDSIAVNFKRGHKESTSSVNAEPSTSSVTAERSTEGEAVAESSLKKGKKGFGYFRWIICSLLFAGA